ncbi:MAG TPA: heparin lyase I family protein [Polyangiaceae bacterium]|nr:heparin lyase I family protein [Polyangiaceae bacterium]
MRTVIPWLWTVALASALGACSSSSGKAGDGASGAGGTLPGSAGKGGAAEIETSTRVTGGTTSHSQSGSLGSTVGGAATTGGTATTGGAPTSGGAATSAAGGSVRTGTSPQILWSDSIQTGTSPWGLDGFGVEHPIGTEVTANDANGANFSVVADPLGSTGYAIRHFATFDTGGSRSQGGLYGDVNTFFGNQAKKPEGVWVAQEWYFPEALSAGGDASCWINLWDFHSVDANRASRWHTAPGLILARDGSMKVGWEWGGSARINPNSALSSIAMPVGRWFDIEMHYVWSDTPTATITLWIDGQLALQQTGVQTRATSHQFVETYLKFYGSTQGEGAWQPTPSLKYTRNVRVAGERIWR